MNAWFLLGALITALLAATDQSLTLTPPAVVVALNGSQLKGTPQQLAWSPDGKSLCLRTLEGDSQGKWRSYLIALDARTFQGLDATPEWAASYWEWKSSRTAPGRPGMVVQVETTNKTGTIPTQSLRDKARGGMIENAVAAREQAGSVTRTLTLKGETIGQYVNQPLVPGMTFGWSPEALHAVAYAKPDGHLAVLDLDAGPINVDGADNVLLPAWSPDGKKVAYLQKTGRRDYVVSTIDVARP